MSKRRFPYRSLARAGGAGLCLLAAAPIPAAAPSPPPKARNTPAPPTATKDPFLTPRPGLPSRDRVQQELKEVLSRPEFRKRGPSPIERFRNWLLDLLERIGFRQPDLRMSDRSIDVVQILVLLAATGGFLFLIYYAVRFGTRRLKEEEIRPAVSLSEPLAPSEELLREAEALARQGEYRQALKKSYVATLIHLGRGKVLEFNPNRTNWENLRTLKRVFPADLARSLQRISRLFDRKWYGLEEIGEEEYRRTAEELALVRGGLAALPAEPMETPNLKPAEAPA